ncbi:hypothetical protein ACFVAV_22080 [Nocardia sp. NPDC057663]|uniref:hypothetical protein n=1 Tax=Nocardia sp. NPDC057663 TaxID=3346201 RepID=UPI003670A3FB
MTTIRVQRAAGIVTLVPQGASTVLDDAPALDVLVLEVRGGHLSWNLLAGHSLPAAVLDDPESAQDWLWAVYGEDAALTVADTTLADADTGRQHTLPAVPARPELANALRRLAYAHWAARWWPASTVDGIPALDPDLLAAEITELTGACDTAVDGADAEPFTRPGESPSRTPDPGTARDDNRMMSESFGRADDYALAAGGSTPAGGGLILARGSGEWDWRRCPPGILDAGENAVSWQVARTAEISTVQVSVVAAPDCRRLVPEHLRPYARVRSTQVATAGRDQAGPSPSAGVEFTMPLHLRGDTWTGSVQIPGPPETFPEPAVFVPGVGPADPAPDESAVRAQIRRFARLRLTEHTGDTLLAAEAAAAETDGDF